MKDWKSELGFEIVKHEQEGQMPIYLVREDFADDREATITERVLWDALVGKTAQSAPAPAASGEPVATVRRAHAGGRVRSIGHQVCDLLPGANVQDGAMLYAAPQSAPARVPPPEDPWRKLYRRAINEANGLTNYVEDRPELRSAEKRLTTIEAEARMLAAAPDAQKGAAPCKN